MNMSVINSSRLIAHIDADAFFASVEQACPAFDGASIPCCGANR